MQAWKQSRKNRKKKLDKGKFLPQSSLRLNLQGSKKKSLQLRKSRKSKTGNKRENKSDNPLKNTNQELQ